MIYSNRYVNHVVNDSPSDGQKMKWIKCQISSEIVSLQQFFKQPEYTSSLFSCLKTQRSQWTVLFLVCISLNH